MIPVATGWLPVTQGFIAVLLKVHPSRPMVEKRGRKFFTGQGGVVKSDNLLPWTPTTLKFFMAAVTR